MLSGRKVISPGSFSLFMQAMMREAVWSLSTTTWNSLGVGWRGGAGGRCTHAHTRTHARTHTHTHTHTTHLLPAVTSMGVK